KSPHSSLRDLSAVLAFLICRFNAITEPTAALAYVVVVLNEVLMRESVDAARRPKIASRNNFRVGRVLVDCLREISAEVEQPAFRFAGAEVGSEFDGIGGKTVLRQNISICEEAD